MVGGSARVIVCVLLVSGLAGCVTDGKRLSTDSLRVPGFALGDDYETDTQVKIASAGKSTSTSSTQTIRLSRAENETDAFGRPVAQGILLDYTYARKTDEGNVKFEIWVDSVFDQSTRALVLVRSDEPDTSAFCESACDPIVGKALRLFFPRGQLFQGGLAGEELTLGQKIEKTERIELGPFDLEITKVYTPIAKHSIDGKKAFEVDVKTTVKNNASDPNTSHLDYTKTSVVHKEFYSEAYPLPLRVLVSQRTSTDDGIRIVETSSTLTQATRGTIPIAWGSAAPTVPPLKGGPGTSLMKSGLGASYRLSEAWARLTEDPSLLELRTFLLFHPDAVPVEVRYEPDAAVEHYTWNILLADSDGAAVQLLSRLDRSGLLPIVQNVAQQDWVRPEYARQARGNFALVEDAHAQAVKAGMGATDPWIAIAFYDAPGMFAQGRPQYEFYDLAAGFSERYFGLGGVGVSATDGGLVFVNSGFNMFSTHRELWISVPFPLAIGAAMKEEPSVLAPGNLMEHFTGPLAWHDPPKTPI